LHYITRGNRAKYVVKKHEGFETLERKQPDSGPADTSWPVDRRFVGTRHALLSSMGEFGDNVRV
jgi:hypothetical protein